MLQMVAFYLLPDRWWDCMQMCMDEFHPYITPIGADFF
jgi:hypothetical protein